MATYVKIRIRRDYEENWRSANPLLLLGEISYNMSNHRIKVGNGTDRWIDLPYVDGGSGTFTIPTTPPSNPKIGDVYYNQTINAIMYWNSAKWCAVGIVIGSTAPASPHEGLVWYNTNNKKLFYYNGSAWTTLGGIAVLPSAPSGPNEGDMYYNSTEKKMYYWNGSAWVFIGLSSSDVTNLINQYFTTNAIITVLESGRPSSPKANMVIYVINEKKMYIYRNNNWLEISASGSSGDGGLIYVATYNATSPTGKTGQILFAENTKQFYRWDGSKWVIMPIVASLDINMDVLKQQIIDAVLADIRIVISDELKNHNIFGLSYTAKGGIRNGTLSNVGSSGKMRYLEFSDGVKCWITWAHASATATSDTRFISSVMSSNNYYIDFLYNGETGGYADNKSGQLIGRNVTKVNDSTRTAYVTKWEEYTGRLSGTAF